MLKGASRLGLVVALLLGAATSVSAQPNKPPQTVLKKSLAVKKLSAAQLASMSGALREIGSGRAPSQLDAKSRTLLDHTIAALADGKGKKLAEARNLARYVVLRSYAAELSAQRGALATHTTKLEALLSKSKAEKARHRVPILTLQPTGPNAYSVKDVDLEVTRDDVLAAISSAKKRTAEVAQQGEEFNRDLQSATQEYGQSLTLVTGLLKAFDETAQSVVQNVK